MLSLDDGSVYSVDIGDQATVSSWSQGDPVAVENSGGAITDLSTGDRVSATLVGDASDQSSYAGMGAHTQATSSIDGSIIVLDDGSIWSVADADQATTSNWPDSTSIVVNHAADGSSSYELVNTDARQTAEANYIGQE